MPIYPTLATDAGAQVLAQAPAPIAQRFVSALTVALAHYDPHRAELAHAFADAMRSQDASLFSPDDPMRGAMAHVVTFATDTVKPEEVDDMANLLYALYGLSLLFWLYDRTPNARATHALIELMGDMLKIARPMMMMPLFSKALSKVSAVLNLTFGKG
jgi:hypothetical protein